MSVLQILYMKYFYSFLFLLYAFTSVAQSADKGKVNFYLGTGANYNTIVTNLSPGDKSQSLATQNRFAISYNTHKQVSVGIELVGNKFLSDDSSSVNVIQSGMGGLFFVYSFMNREKSRAYIGTTVGAFNFNFNVLDSLNNTGKLVGEGVYNKVYLGYNKYFGKRFGLYVQSGLMNMPITMKSLTINGDPKQYFDKKLVTEWKVLMRGGFLSFGLTINIL